jgi:hypothetical protein
LIYRSSASDSAADLNLCIGRGENCLDLDGVVSTSRDPIQVNDVKVMESVLSPCTGYPDRIGYTQQLLVIGVSRDLYTGSSPQVKRGNCYHPR